MADNNIVVWANIPVTDIARAKKFYSELLGVEMQDLEGYGGAVAVPAGSMGEEGGVAFNLLMTDDFKPSQDGVRVVLAAKGDIDGMVQRGLDAGGKLLQEPEQMGAIGVLAQMMDSEGNIVTLMK